MAFMNKCYQLLDSIPPSDHTPDDNVKIVLQFRDLILSESRVDEIMQAFRLISSEKFRHVHTYSFTNREDQEVKRQLKQF